ncbi:hypothetical protein H5U98_25345 [Mycolicibacterium boenickei]|uniref:DUF732 domain-containing protein n=1 Tax=Mycolicibacterium boenickei TaxID=146017 RepID=A0AAX2ZVP7_9MYCO|nr:hypothetical protein [Mycolicibacterium boenickei]UNB98795.1 hypothetical protein H5U98_25345 [Mycolicibacterium boenickei]BBX94659.1 hypothetical protein MBOE_63080 [Mycolicibacterium boenickei]
MESINRGTLAGPQQSRRSSNFSGRIGADRKIAVRLLNVAVVMAFLSLTHPGIAAADPIQLPDLPNVDESLAYTYAMDHQREICSILDYRFAQTAPAVEPIDAIMAEVAARSGFNLDTAGFAVGVAMGTSCPQYVDRFETAADQELA